MSRETAGSGRPVFRGVPNFEGGKSNEKSSCIYYPEKGKGIGEGKSFQLCFTNGKLDSKNVY